MPVRSQNPSGGTVIVASLFLSMMMGLSVVAGYRMALQDTRARVVTDRGLDIELVKRPDGRIYLLQEASLKELTDKDVHWHWQTEINPDGTCEPRIRVGGWLVQSDSP